MISLRQHVTSLVAVFLALAVGIVLGGGPLSAGAGAGDDGGAGRSAPTGTSTPAPVAEDLSAFSESFAGEGAARLYANGLNTHASAIVAMPGADPAQVKALQAQIVSAGGAITGTYSVGPALLDPDEEELVDTVGAQLTTQLADPRLDPAATTYDRMGALLALAMATRQVSSVRADPAAVTVRKTLAGAELLTAPAAVRNAPLVLVVLPPGADGAEGGLATRTALSGLVNGLGSEATGVVVVGDAESAEDGELAALRGSGLVGPVSTVDGIDTTIGQVTSVLAMIDVVSGTVGSYGASGSDGVVPLP